MTKLYEPTLTEAQWTTWVIDTARWHGWMATHFRPALTARGYRTAVQGDNGFVDIVLARAGVVILAELKVGRGRLRPEQKQWAAAIGAQHRLWKPEDRDQVLAELARPTLSAPRTPAQETP